MRAVAFTLGACALGLGLILAFAGFVQAPHDPDLDNTRDAVRCTSVQGSNPAELDCDYPSAVTSPLEVAYHANESLLLTVVGSAFLVLGGVLFAAGLLIAPQRPAVPTGIAPPRAAPVGWTPGRGRPDERPDEWSAGPLAGRATPGSRTRPGRVIEDH